MEFVQKAVRTKQYRGDGQTFKLNGKMLNASLKGAVMLPTVPTPERARGELEPGPGLRPEIVALDTLEAVIKLAQEGFLDPGVLVFASDTNPGGSRKGKNLGTQEEALCRLSTLRLAQEQLEYPIPTLGVAYVPQVQGLLPSGVVGFGAVCSALRQCLADETPTAKEAKFLEAKVQSVLGTAVAFGHRSLVLGAWGCGAFGNPPKAVSKAFASQLQLDNFQGAFDRVLFAIPDDALRRAFVETFEEAFGEALVCTPP
ncbi:hypothetical protein AK812_SmicGene42450 [Symbiodinium microadriaticum]|uniref:Microbial-type PARG catalytic domain-containing protein n=1 Tax=Symbiodinium microadriaticum TaxID=2951 RepID=A0A1Q9C3L0_SYMMI|nr:hypothetical protein AK812_SmicGene42450 [Symbiodinium microadriaticum]CAE7683602.1 unnamed protein product [Symbiodinium microadriaticum]